MFTRPHCSFAGALASIALCFGASAQDIIIDTGPGNDTGIGGVPALNFGGGNNQYVGMQFTLDDPVTITRFDAWGYGSGTFTVKLRQNTFNAPGAELESESIDIESTVFPEWVAFDGIEWSVDPGTYWVTFEVDPFAGDFTFAPEVPEPLDGYAFYSDSNGFWIPLDVDQLLGLRVWDDSASEAILVPSQFPTIQSAMDFASDGAIIEVAPGTYNEAINYFGKTITVRSSGGPAVTIIDGTGFSGATVDVTSGSAVGTRLEGFTVTGGSHLTGFAQGGGILVFGGTITVADCIILDNIAESGGGAAVVFSGTAEFENCSFISNSSSGGFGSGGAVYLNNGDAGFTTCTFTENESDGGGAINVNVDASCIADLCTFSGNSSTGSGGAVLVIGSTASASFFSSTFENNTSVQGGGVMIINAPVNLVGCDFIGNEATFAGSTSGGGVQAQGSATVTIASCDFVGNQAHLGGGVQFISLTGSASISSSSFHNNTANLNGGGVQILGGNAPSIGTSDFCGNAPNDISGSFSNSGGNTFNGSCTPANDDPEDPQPVSLGIAIGASFEGASNSGTSSCEPDGVDLFYEFEITNGPTSVVINTCGSEADTALAVFDDLQNEIACNASCDGDPCGPPGACLTLINLDNGVYVIRVSMENGAVAGTSLDFVLNIEEAELEVLGDFNNDQIVDESDRAMLCAALGTSTGHPDFIEAADFDDNGVINQLDQIEFNSILPPCPGDIVSSLTIQPPSDGVIDGADLAFLIGAWGNQSSCADMVSSRTILPPPDGKVDGADLAYLLGAWGTCP